VIRSFRSKALRRYWQRNDRRGIRPDWLPKIAALLSLLDQIGRPEEVGGLGAGFHSLKGDQAGRYALTVSRTWRLTFGWDGEDVIDVDLEDYHGD
jgi:proteic killer suppression protein